MLSIQDYSIERLLEGKCISRAGGQCCDLVRHCCPSIYDNVTILKTPSTPANMVFSKCFLHRKYRTPHLVGVLLCIIGVINNVIQDSHYEKDGISSYKLLNSGSEETSSLEGLQEGMQGLDE